MRDPLLRIGPRSNRSRKSGVLAVLIVGKWEVIEYQRVGRLTQCSLAVLLVKIIYDF